MSVSEEFVTISNFFSFALISFADFSILYIQSFVYTVYDELAGQRQGPGPSGKGVSSCYSHISTTETDTGEQPQLAAGTQKSICKRLIMFMLHVTLVMQLSFADFCLVGYC